MNHARASQQAGFCGVQGGNPPFLAPLTLRPPDSGTPHREIKFPLSYGFRPQQACIRERGGGTIIIEDAGQRGQPEVKPGISYEGKS